ncbi:LysR substrate-binding domain-containing protein [Robbsia sp. KACC 23696]|uniref:LysR substrate-binding domain-containing protein n=1 Tax=Robbsia sp. KACC 23696 TaxID=3149231 RepID=UPI00325BCFE8
MNFRQTEVFKAIMETGSVTQAAARLCVSQPSISKSLQALEQDLHVQLFERTARGLVATVEAHSLYEEVERAYGGITSLSRYAAGLRHMKHARLVVSSITVLAMQWLPRVVSRFVADYPQTNLTVQSWDSSRTAQMVAEGQIDFGIAQSKVNEQSVGRLKLFEIETVCVLPRDHRLAGATFVEAEDLRGETLVLLSTNDEIRVQLEKILHDRDIPVTSFIDATLGVTLCALIEHGCGIGVVDTETARLYANDRLVFRPFKPAIQMSVYLMRTTARAPSAIASTFQEYVLEEARKR